MNELVSRTTFPRRAIHAGSKSTMSAVKELKDRTDSGGSAVVALSGGDNGEQACVIVDDEEQ